MGLGRRSTISSFGLGARKREIIKVDAVHSKCSSVCYRIRTARPNGTRPAIFHERQNSVTTYTDGPATTFRYAHYGNSWRIEDNGNGGYEDDDLM